MKRALVLAPALIVLVATADLRAEETPPLGGVLKVATVGEPPTLDIQMSTTVLTYDIMWHVFESLFTYDHAFNPIPLLAESHGVGDRGLRHTITLRRAVRFHHGKEMTAADVVASIERWGRVATLGRILWKGVESIEARDSYTVVLHLKQPSSSLVYGLAEPAAMIYPRETIEAAGDGQVKEFIGTGPYRFVEHKPDRDRKSTRLNSSHDQISYAVFCLNKKIVIGSKHITLNATGGGFLTASNHFRHGATSKSRTNTASNLTKHTSPHLSDWRQIISLIT